MHDDKSGFTIDFVYEPSDGTDPLRALGYIARQQGLHVRSARPVSKDGPTCYFAVTLEPPPSEDAVERYKARVAKMLKARGAVVVTSSVWVTSCRELRSSSPTLAAGSGAPYRAESVLDTLGKWMPSKCEPVLGDIYEDLAEKRAEGWNERELRRHAYKETFYTLVCPALRACTTTLLRLFRVLVLARRVHEAIMKLIP